jgi:cytochrome c-type biogenesis protein
MFSSAMFLDATLLPAILIALAAGLLSFLSPCVLPIVPPYLAYMGGVSVGEMADAQGRGREARGRALLAAAFFVLGLSTVFLLLGAAASAFGRALLQWQGWFVPAAGLVTMIFGAHFLGVLRIPFLAREARFEAGDRGGSAFGAYVLGLAFAFGWTPCLGPILGAILGLAATEAAVGRGTTLLAAYALGLGIPFLLVAAFFPRMGALLALMRRHMGWIERTSGLLLWTVGLLMLTGQFTAFSWWLLETFPALATIG